MRKTLIAVIALAFCAGASAQSPIKMPVGFPPGGSADTTARALADKLKDSLGAPVEGFARRTGRR